MSTWYMFLLIRFPVDRLGLHYQCTKVLWSQRFFSWKFPPPREGSEQSANPTSSLGRFAREKRPGDEVAVNRRKKSRKTMTRTEILPFSQYHRATTRPPRPPPTPARPSPRIHNWHFKCPFNPLFPLFKVTNCCCCKSPRGLFFTRAYFSIGGACFFKILLSLI